MMNKNALILLVLIGAIIIFMLAVILVINREAKTAQQGATPNTAAISGALNINGIVPQGATVTLTANVHNTSQEKIFAAGLPAVDGDSWNFSDAVAGEAYDIQAKVLLNGQVIAQSSPFTVTAPADEENITLNVSPLTPQPTPNAVISGNIIVNGYIPSDATILVQGRKLGSQTFNTIAEGLPGQSRQFMSYTTALSGVTYEVEAQLLAADGTNIGTSGTLIVTAPAINESLTINSTAQTPATPTPTIAPTTTPVVVTATAIPATPTPVATPTPIAISGTIDFNGVTPPNSRIVVFQKVYNSQNYQVAVDNITPTDGATWSWTSPQASTWYDMIAVLKQQQSNGTDLDLATSAVVSVAAPASNVTLTVNSSFSLPSPSGPIVVTCGTLSGSTWNATVSLAPVSTAGSYWIQIGTSNGGADLMNSTFNAMNNNSANQTISASLINSTTYYVRYAYAEVANLSAGSTQFSPFSGTTQAYCTN